MVAMTKQERIDNETMRRAQAGDFSDYVKKQLEGEYVGGERIGAAERLGVDRPIEASTPAWKSEPQNQGTAMELINQLSSTPSWNDLRGMKEQLVGIPAITTDPNENRNMYQYLINEMLQNDRGAKLLDVNQIPENWRRTGGTTWTDPANPDLWRDLKGLIPPFDNPGVYNLNEVEGGGLASFPQFQEGWAKDELGITDWGGVVGNIFTPTPLKIYDAMRKAKERVMESDLYGDAADTLSNIGIGSIETTVKPVQWLAEQIDKLNKKFTGNQ